ncbi:MAG: hypothetical protein WCF85_01895 [Rhodospirillaceae bacterium]
MPAIRLTGLLLIATALIFAASLGDRAKAFAQATTAKPKITAPKIAAPVPVPPPSPAPAEATEPSKVKVGMYITQLYDFDMAKRSFSVTFWGWFIHADQKYKPLENVEIVNAKSSTVKFSAVLPKETKEGTVYWDQAKYSAIIGQDWDIQKFPFDTQKLIINLEDGVNDTTSTVFVADSANTNIDSSVKIPGWSIESLEIKSSDTVYNTTFGDPTLQGSSTYSKISAIITVKREGFRLLLSTFIGFFVAFALVSLTYFIDTEWMAGSRVGLCGGAIFASVGNMYVINNYLPPVSIFTLADAIEASTFVTIIFAILTVVMVKALKDIKKPELAERMNTVCAAISLISYPAFNMWAIYQATS